MRRPRYLTTLAGNLINQFKRTGNVADLDEAVECCEEAVSIAWPRSPELDGILGIYASALGNRYDLSNDVADLNAAVWVEEERLKITSVKSLNYPHTLHGFANSLRKRFYVTGARSDLQRAISLRQEALDLIPANHVDIAMVETGLANDLLARYHQFHDEADLYSAAKYYEDSLRSTARDSPNYPVRASNLGMAAIELEQVEPAPSLSDVIDSAFDSACRYGELAAPERAMISSSTWGDWLLSKGCYVEAAAAYEYGVRIAQKIVNIQLTREAQAEILKIRQSVFSQCARAHVLSGNLKRAVECLEAGRALLISERFVAPFLVTSLTDKGWSGLARGYEKRRAGLAVLQSQL